MLVWLTDGEVPAVEVLTANLHIEGAAAEADREATPEVAAAAQVRECLLVT